MEGLVLITLLCIPALSALGLLFFPRYKNFGAWISATGAVQLVWLLWIGFSPWSNGGILQAQWAWFQLGFGSAGHFQAWFALSLDPLRMAFLMMTAGIFILSGWAWSKHLPRSAAVFFLTIFISVTGVFLAVDLFLFFVFFELMLPPVYFLIGIWGGNKRLDAAIKLFFYTLAGSLCILMALVALTLSTGSTPASEAAKEPQLTLLFQHLYQPSHRIPGSLLDAGNSISWLGMHPQFWVFWSLIVAFSIKIPLVPLHTWLPDAHTQAPTPVSMVLAGLLLKVGLFGLMVLILPVFTEPFLAHKGFLAFLGWLSLMYGGLLALAQTDIKRMIAYSSVAHMGLAVIGLASATTIGFAGAGMGMISHAFLSAGLFAFAGILEKKTGTRQLNDFGGLYRIWPVLSICFSFLAVASLGLPGFSAFVGEFLSLLGAAQAWMGKGWLFWILVPGSLIGIWLGAVYFIRAVRKLILGPAPDPTPRGWEKQPDLLGRDFWVLAIPIVLSLFLGILPQGMLRLLEWPAVWGVPFPGL